MRHVLQTLGMLTLSLAGLESSASEFSPLLSVTQAVWPNASHIGVVCDYQDGRDQIEALCEAAAPGTRVTVLDTRSPENAPRISRILAAQKPDYMVLLPRGRVFREGSFEASLLVRNLAYKGVPSVGTTPNAILQGAVFAIGEGTRGELLVTERLVGTISVELPSKGQFLRATASAGGATLGVIALD